MSTRNMTLIYQDGIYKVSKYCQWDGYLSGLGLELMSTLKALIREPELEASLKEAVRNGVVQVTPDDVSKLWEECGADDSGMVNLEVSAKFRETNWDLHRDCNGADVLTMLIKKQKVRNVDDISFVADSLFCEYAYVIDLDKDTFEIYRGFNQQPLTEEDRFYDLSSAGEYQPVSLLRSYSFYEINGLNVSEEIEFLEETLHD